MNQHKVYHHSGEIDFSINEIDYVSAPSQVLMCSPDFFDIVDIKNPYMDGNSGLLSKELAKKQWGDLKDQYSSLVKQNLLTNLSIIQGQKDCEDMVFAANQTFPWLKNQEEKVVVLSKMKHASRQKEVPYYKKFFESKGYKILELTHTKLFEGMGDLIPHPKKKLLYGGYGFRTEQSAYQEISELLDTSIICLKLINENFYHLDTCFVPLGENSVMLLKEAFDAESYRMVESLFSKIYHIPKKEAIEGFALNAHIVFAEKEKVALLQKGNIETYKILESEGIKVIETDTSEFIKSGGSVFCMKMMYY